LLSFLILLLHFAIPSAITMSDAPHKAHRPSQSGKKAEKKDVAKGKDRSGGSKGFNEKVSKKVLPAR
jgi:hypothetical protein